MSVKLATEVVIIYVLTTLVVTVVDAILVMSFTPERDAGEFLVTQGTGRVQAMDEYLHLVTVIHRCTMEVIARLRVIMDMR